MMRCERIERLAKTAASGQRTKPPRLSQRPEARHSFKWLTGRRTAFRLPDPSGISAMLDIFYSRRMGGS